MQKAVNERYPEIHIINSVDYAISNNMYSAYLGKDSMGDSPFLMMNADVFFDSSVIKKLLEFESPNAIVVEIGRYIEESMKVVEKEGKLVEISKQITPDRAFGTSIDIYKFSELGGKAFFGKCEEYINNGDLKKWSEVAINAILPGQSFQACPLVGRWFEIDNLDDLREAEVLFGT